VSGSRVAVVAELAALEALDRVVSLGRSETTCGQPAGAELEVVADRGGGGGGDLAEAELAH